MPADGQSKYAIIVEFQIHRDRYDDFIDLMRANAKTSLAVEEGCEQFDVLESTQSEGSVLLYEIYKDQSAFDAHMNERHYREFAARSEDMIKSKIVKAYRTLS